jgi:hypothetical protein
MNGRILRAAVAATFLAIIGAASATAGGWATIVPDAGDPPVAGKESAIGFTVMQHGATPAGGVNPIVVASNSTTGERIEAKATDQGAEGHYIALLTLPSGGYWTWRVECELEVTTAPLSLAVANANGAMPAVDASTLQAALDQTRAALRTEYQEQLFAETDSLRTEVQTLSSRITVLQAQRDTLKKQLDEAIAEPAAAAAPVPADGVPVIAVVAIAALAGAAAGFAMTLLGRSQAPGGRIDGAIEEVGPSQGAAPAH